jgi:hypothetical protein
LRNIPAESDVIGIRVKAVSKIGLIGEFTPLGKFLIAPVFTTEKNDSKGNKKNGKEDTVDKGIVCRTKGASRRRLLNGMLLIAESNTDVLIDTDFFTGVQQRLQTTDFIEQIKAELVVTPFI